PESGGQCRDRRPRRRPTARGRRHPPLLHERGGSGGARCLSGEARPRLLPIPQAPVNARVWWQGARPRTLGAGTVPVLVGAAAAGHVVWWRFAFALVVALGLQIGVNLANDYFDGVRG